METPQSEKSPPSKPFADWEGYGPEKLNYLRFLREEDRHEITWINHRLGWMRVSQSFLMTAAITAQSTNYAWWWGMPATFILGTVGVWLALRGALAVRCAVAVSEAWLMAETKFCERKPGGPRIPRAMALTGIAKDDHLHGVACKLHLNMHVPLVFAWFLLFVGGTCVGLHRRYPESFRAKVDPWLDNPGVMFVVLAMILLLVGTGFFTYLFVPERGRIWMDIKKMRKHPTLKLSDDADGQPADSRRGTLEEIFNNAAAALLVRARAVIDELEQGLKL